MEGIAIHTRSQLNQHSFSWRHAVATWLLLCVALVCTAFAQQPFPTSRGDNTRSGANTSETLLTPGNVNKGSFGHLFSSPVDYQVLAQPLYVPNVTMADQSIHNVIYIVTQMDSVYAIDADNGSQLWYASMLDGGVPASGKYLPCGTLGGFNQEGIIGTPAIDLTTNTMYLVAKTLLNGTVYHYLHALDITSGKEQVSMGSPVQITASSVSNKGTVMHFTSLHQKNRPGLLLLNGVLYMAFGSNGCNDHNTGWVLSYDATSLQQLGAFNTSPDIGLTSPWQSGNGLAADEAGNIFVSTAESTNYDVPQGGQSYSNSVLKLSPGNVALADYFTPWSVAYLNSNDLDVSSGGPLVLPDQSGPYPHEVIASGKQAIVYVLNRDNMGMFSANDSQIIQEFPLIVGGELMCSPAYWNETVYYSPGGAPVQSFQVSNGLLNPFAQTSQRYVGAHSPSISANGNTNGILWLLSGNNLDAFDAVSLNLLYSSNQSGTRDKLPKLAHFATQTVANGRIYVATQNSLEVYGLFHILTVTGGNNQTAPVLNPLPAPLQITASNPYTGQPKVGVTVTFSDGNKGGTFNPPSAVTNSNGAASTIYTFPQKAGTYTLTVSAPSFGNVTATEIATPAAVQKLIAYEGARQTGAAGSVLPNPIVAEALDAYKNPVPGVSVNFASNKGGVPNPGSVVTNAKGLAPTYFQLPTVVGTITVTANSSGLKSVTFPETSVAGPLATLTLSGGNNQAGAAGTTLPQALTVVAADQYGNPVSGVLVNFSDGGAGGSFSYPNPVTTNNAGTASQFYTLPWTAGTITITASANGVNNPAVFTENSVPGPPANVSVAGGNYQSGAAGTQLPQALTALVTDLFGNPVAGVSVYFNDSGAGGTFSNPNPVATSASGTAAQFYTFSPFLGTVTITATAAGVNNPAVFTENSVSGPAAYVYITGGNNQSAPAGSQLPQALTVLVTDQYGNPVPGVSVGFTDGGAGGAFSNPNPVATDNSGTATQRYTLPPNPGTVYIYAAATGVANPVVFTETGQ